MISMTSTAPVTTTRRRSVSTGTLLNLSIAAGPVFAIVATVQAVGRDGFDLRRHPLSQLATGDLGFVQIINFVLAGIGVLCLAVAQRRIVTDGVGRRWLARLIGGFGVGLVAAGVFPMDPQDGFPVGTPAGPAAQMSWHGVAHSVAAAAAYTSLAAACIVFTVRKARQRARAAGRAQRCRGARILTACDPGLGEHPDGRQWPGRLQLDDRGSPRPSEGVAGRRRGGRAMKYLLLSYTPADAWDLADADTGTPSEEALAAFAVYAEFQRELTASGELVATEGLGHPSLSQTLRKQADAVTVTDGPFAEFKEVLASYAVLDCASHDRALEIARRLVEAIGDAGGGPTDHGRGLRRRRRQRSPRNLTDRCTRTKLASSTCCALKRHRCLARWSADSATSRWPRMPSRRHCSPRCSGGRPKGCLSTLAAG